MDSFKLVKNLPFQHCFALFQQPHLLVLVVEPFAFEPSPAASAAGLEVAYRQARAGAHRVQWPVVGMTDQTLSLYSLPR